MKRRALVPILAFVALALGACGHDPFGAPARVSTHGYRAHVTVKQSGQTTEQEIAVRGADRRLEPRAGGPGPVRIWSGAAKKVYELDPATKSYRELPETTEPLPGYPLAPGFSDAAEAARRGITKYRRESDSVFAGHACWLASFEDRPEEPGSPSTTYWVAPDLDNLVVRVDREVPRPDGAKDVTVTQLTDVRVSAQPELFQVPSGYVQR